MIAFICGLQRNKERKSAIVNENKCLDSENSSGAPQVWGECLGNKERNDIKTVLEGLALLVLVEVL